MKYLVATAAVFLLAVPAGTHGVPVQERSPVENYLDATIARLELVRNSWADADRPPTAVEEARLLDDYGFSTQGYYRFAGKHREAIELYLESNPEIRDEIESLSQQIQDFLR